ncbi:MAG: gluzincin family metallopeptidase [Candidatus Xenobia bacterium]
MNDYARWDLTPYFPEFDGAEYRQFMEKLEQDIDAMLQREHPASAQFLLDYEALGARADHVGSYLECLSAADATNERISSEYARLDALGARMEKVSVRVQAGLRDLTDEAFATLLEAPELAGAEFPLRTLRERGKQRMASDLEMLAADLGVDGINAWGRLYDQISGRLEFELKLPDGSCRKVPMAQKISLIEDPDPAVRKATLAGSNAAWASMEDTVTAALNAIAGWRLTLDRWRSMSHFLDAALFDARMSRQTLQMMLDVIRSRAEIPREYLRLKARLLGRPRLGFQDLSAPLPLDTPYAFGFLFSMGVFARFKQEGPSFLRRYEELLRLTGSDTVEGVAQRALGVDLTKPDFWNGSIDLIEQDLKRFTDTLQKANIFTTR